MIKIALFSALLKTQRVELNLLSENLNEFHSLREGKIIRKVHFCSAGNFHIFRVNLVKKNNQKCEILPFKIGCGNLFLCMGKKFQNAVF